MTSVNLLAQGVAVEPPRCKEVGVPSGSLMRRYFEDSLSPYRMAFNLRFLDVWKGLDRLFFLKRTFAK